MSHPAPSSRSDWLFQALTRAAGVGVLAVVASLVGVLVAEAWPVLSRAGHYQLFTSSEWVPSPADGGPPVYGALALIWGTVVTSVIAMLVAVPLGVASAAYMSEIARPWLRKVGALLIELLAAIPSVVYGFWGLVFLVPLLRQGFAAVGGPTGGGEGVLAAGLILAVMILPYITAISFDVCQAVPRSQREGSLALGATRWQTIRNVVLPYARPGIVAAAFLALGRALGETMAVTMLIGNREVIELSPFARGDSIASKIANQLNEADSPELRSALIALAVVLLGVTAGFNLLARVLLGRLTRGPGGGGRGPAAGAESTAGADPANPERERGGSTTPSLALGVRPEPVPPPRSTARRWDRVMTGVLAGCLLLTVGPLFLILGFITVRGAGAVSPALFTENAVEPPLTNPQFDQYRTWQQTGRAEDYPRAFGRNVYRSGLGHAMLGSLMMVGAAALMAVPPGLMAAVYLAEARRSRLANAVRFAAELLGGVPSIVVGIFAFACLVKPFWWSAGLGDPPGFSGWAGAFALAVMMIPIVVRGAEEALRLVPDSLRQASYALGASKAQTTLRVVLPAALPAVVTAVFLAVGRVAGETAPLLLTAGQSNFWPVTVDGSAPFVHPRMAAYTPFLPGYIYRYSRDPSDDLQDQAWGAAVVLLAVVLLVNVGVRLLAGKRVVAASRAD